MKPSIAVVPQIAAVFLDSDDSSLELEEKRNDLDDIDDTEVIEMEIQAESITARERKLKTKSSLKNLLATNAPKSAPKTFFPNRQNSFLQAIAPPSPNYGKEEKLDISHNHLGDHVEKTKDEITMRSKKAKKMILINLCASIVVFMFQLTVAVISMSLSLSASAYDTFLDLLFAAIFFMTLRKSMKYDKEKYPSGHGRFEPLGLIIFAVVMGMSAFELLRRSLTKIILTVQGQAPRTPKMDSNVYILIGVVLFLKIVRVLYIKYLNRRNHSHVLTAFALEQRNDIIANVLGVVTATVASRREDLWWFDPAGGALFAFFILFSWLNTGKAQLSHLAGASAPQAFVDQLNTLVSGFDDRIVRVDKVIAYHVGIRFQTEITLSIDSLVQMKDSVEIISALRKEVESFPQVDKAFIILS